MTVTGAAEGNGRPERLQEVVAGMAHDLNNALAVILNYAVLAKHDLRKVAAEGQPRVERVGDHLSEIQGAAEHAVELTVQLHALARPERVSPPDRR